MKQIKQRLYGLYFIVVAVFILLLSFLLQNVVEEQIVNQQRTSLNDEINYLTTYVKEENTQDSLNKQNIINTLSNVSIIIHERITFMDLDGNPLYDSRIPVVELDNMIKAAEIQQVLLGETTGISRRPGVTTKSEQYYIAQVIFDSNNNPIGILRLASEATNITDIIEQVLIIQIFGTILLVFVIIVLSRNWVNVIANAMADMDEVVTDLTHSDYEARYVGHSYRDIDRLGESINELQLF